MIFDPFDIDMALREDLVLLWHHNGEVWVPMQEIQKATNRPDDFTRPSW